MLRRRGGPAHGDDQAAGLPGGVPKRDAPSFLSQQSRDMVVDVLRHVATGGEAEVAAKYFDPNFGQRKVTLVRNTQLSAVEVLQLLFERMGFPPDLVSDYLVEFVSNPQFPASVSSILAAIGESSPHKALLTECCWDLFETMLWESLDQQEEGGDEPVDETAVEDELEQVNLIFGDHFVSEVDYSDGGGRELLYTFSGIDDAPIHIRIRLGPSYPKDPPLVFLDVPNPKDRDGPLCISPLSFTVRFDARREVLDAAVDVIKSGVGECVLTPLLGTLQGVICGIKVECPTAASIEKQRVDQERDQQARAAEAKKKEEDRVAKTEFVTSLGALAAPKTGGPAADSGASQSPVSSVLPAAATLDVVEGKGRVARPRKAGRINRDPEVDERLRAEWDTLRTTGSLMGIRNNLPAAKERDVIRDALRRHNAIVVSGETGSGKTTQVPQFLYEYCCEAGNGSLANILCTQPRRLAATSVAMRVADERGESIGNTVGYSIRLENKTSANTRILYCTTGIVLRRLQTDPLLAGVTHVVVDEIHERGVDTDFLLILLKDLLEKRSDIKVILMSATMNSDLFSRYFHGAPVVTIGGRTHPVDTMPLEKVVELTKYSIDDGSPYAIAGRRPKRGGTVKRNTRLNGPSVADEEELDEDAAKYKGLGVSARTAITLSIMDPEVINFELVAALVEHICTEKKGIDGAILIFMPGLAEITACIEEMRASPLLNRSCLFFNLHSSLGSDEQRAVFKPPPKGMRKVIVGTNIMETSITIDDAVFVIDSGKVKENRYDPRRSLSQLVLCTISKANARQRAGRAGRVRPGFCYQLFSTPEYEKMADHQVCEMHRVPLESLVLQIYTLNLGDEMDFLSKALSPPERKAVESSVKVLTSMGALTSGKRLTSLGAHLANLPIDVRIGKMVIHGALLSCLDPVLTIAACLAVKSPFVSLMEHRNEISATQRAFAGEYRSDQLAAWFAYRRWASYMLSPKNGGKKEAMAFAKANWLSHQTLLQIQSTKRQYEWFLLEAGFIQTGASSIIKSSNRFVFPAYETLDDQIIYEAGGIPFNTNSSDAKVVSACLVAGLFPNIARALPNPSKVGNPKLATMDGSMVEVHPSSVLARQSGVPPLYCYVDKIKTSAIYLREVTSVTPFHVVLFGSVELTYLPDYDELVVDNALTFRCSLDEATLLKSIRDQFAGALRTKINDPAVSWESVAATVVRAILRLLKDEGRGTKAMVVVDKGERKGLTSNIKPPSSGSGQQPVAKAVTPSTPTAPAVPTNQPFKTNRSCFNCGEFGHVSRYCPNPGAPKERGAPAVKCFICGQWHHPANCSHAAPSQ